MPSPSRTARCLSMTAFRAARRANGFRTLRQGVQYRDALLILLLLTLVQAGCHRADGTARAIPQDVTLTVGFGLLNADSSMGLQTAASNLALEGLVVSNDDGRAHQRLAETWSTSADGLTL